MAMPKGAAPAPALTTDDLLARGAILIRKIEDCQRQLLDDPAKLEEAARLAAELNALPVMIGELERRRVLSHLEAMAEQARTLTAEYEAAKKAYDEYDAESVELRRQLRASPNGPERTRQQGAFDKRGKESDKLRGKVMTIGARLDSLYAVACRSYGVFLDGSPRQVMHRDGLAPGLSFSAAWGEAAWEAAARRVGDREADRARRALLGNVIRPLAVAW